MARYDEVWMGLGYSAKKWGWRLVVERLGPARWRWSVYQCSAPLNPDWRNLKYALKGKAKSLEEAKRLCVETVRALGVDDGKPMLGVKP